MTVKELIEKLKEMPQDNLVVNPKGYPISSVWKDTMCREWEEIPIKIVAIG